MGNIFSVEAAAIFDDKKMNKGMGTRLIPS